MLRPFRRKAVCPANPFRLRPQVTALEDRWVPSTITEIALPPINLAGSYRGAITSGPDGNVWFTDPALRSVGRISPAGQVTEFTPPSPDNAPSRGAGNAITAGPDGNVWFATEVATGSISRVTPAGQFATFFLGDNLASVNGLTAGPDGNVWFTEDVYPFTVEKVGRITPTGQITEWSIAAPAGMRGSIGNITVGPNGNLWFTHDGVLATITPSGVLRDHVAENVGPALTTGPDGNLWASGPRWDSQTHAFAGDFIERISLTGSVTTFSVGTSSSDPSSIAAGPDGNLWFTEPDANQIGRITPAGQITLFTVPTAASQPTGIAAGPNGNIWFTEAASRHVGEYILPATRPTVAGVRVNDGSAQRSEVKSITVSFSGPVSFAGGTANAAAAFQLQRFTDGANVALAAAVSSDGAGNTIVTLTFSGSESDPLSALNGATPSLADGRYTLAIFSADVTGTNGLALDGGGANGNYVSPPDTYRGNGLHLYRLFGDVNGDGVVDATDLGLLRSALNSNSTQAIYLWYLDADNSGAVDATDLGQFRTRYNTNVFGP
ncbi:MAG TPA: dockerin type I domain-containing protein [Gemmataceae bacterium]|nr:dockerin type I domain-containing protein [Gemmataceae bacterium]